MIDGAHHNAIGPGNVVNGFTHGIALYRSGKCLVQGKGAAEGLLKKGFAAVFLAPGLWEPMRLKKNPAPIRGVFTATDFLC